MNVKTDIDINLINNTDLIKCFYDIIINDTYELPKRWDGHDFYTVIHPMKSTTYSSCFVSLVDRFGMRRELMTEQTER